MQNHLDKDRDKLHQHPAVANEVLRKALARRERFLERHPHLRAYQAEIDRVLDQSGNCQGRMAVLGTMMQGKLLEMQTELDELTHIFQQSINSNPS